MATDPTKDKSQQAIADAEAEAAAKKAARDAANAEEAAALQALQAKELEGLQQHNAAQYSNLGQIVGDIQSKIDVAKAKDETAQKRENAYRYISGLGDTLSSLANLVGVANKASNQQQTYNSNAVVQKAEEARKARKIEMDDLSKRLDEMRIREREMKASGSLAEAQLRAKQARESLELNSKQRQNEQTARQYDAAQIRQAERDARADFIADRSYNAQQEQTKQAQENWQKTYNMQYAKFKEEQKGNKYNFTFADGSFDIPKDKLNEVNVERIFQMLPKELRDSIKGEQYTEIIPADDPMMEPTRKTSYKAPSLAQKLAAIGAYADSDSRIKDELLRLTEDKPKPSTTQQTYTTQSVTQPQSQNTIGANKGGWWYDQYANANQGDYVSDPFAEFN